ncbi:MULTISPECIES: DDE-type integrase/transposase/recombinase [Streptomyces]|uniref:DDE-type integrase/transposase/recombinase n=2 Tax=Streptomyces TaxID=1883 RepID=A0ABV9IRK1_9ACTN
MPDTNADLVVADLYMAVATRGADVRGVIFHSDCGSEYASRKFRRACRKLGVTQSVGRVGSCFDNAVSEAFNSVLKSNTPTGHLVRPPRKHEPVRRTAPVWTAVVHVPGKAQPSAGRS